MKTYKLSLEVTVDHGDNAAPEEQAVKDWIFAKMRMPGWMPNPDGEDYGISEVNIEGANG